jgi:hypothetical protein
LGNTAEPKLRRILVAAKYLYHLANGYWRRMSGRTSQKQDGEYRSNGAKGSTQHRFEIPPRIFPGSRSWKGLYTFKLFGRLVEAQQILWFLLKPR